MQFWWIFNLRFRYQSFWTTMWPLTALYVEKGSRQADLQQETNEYWCQQIFPTENWISSFHANLCMSYMRQDDLQWGTSEHLCHQIHTTQIRLNFSCLFQTMKDSQVTHNKKIMYILFCLISLSTSNTCTHTAISIWWCILYHR